MKKLICALLIMLVPATGYCVDPNELSTYSDEKTADAAIMAVGTKTASFDGIAIMPDGTNNVTVSIYDNASAASGTEVIPTMTFAGDGGPQAFYPPRSIRVFNGIYVDVTTSGTVAYSVYYRK